jgi:hypothetical protein
MKLDERSARACCAVSISRPTQESLSGTAGVGVLSAVSTNNLLQIAAAFVLYQSVSILYFGRGLISDFSHRYVGYWTDPGACIWFLNWWPYALLHHLNPFICRLVWAPGGFNIAWSTSMPAAGLLSAPITLAFGPIVTYNVLCLSAPALSALAGFILCRRLNGSFSTAFIGGYVFGFSTYFIAQMEHLPLMLVFPIPLMLLLAIERYSDSISRAKFLIGMSLMIALQYLLMKEIVATAALVGAFAIMFAIALAPAAAKRAMLQLGLEVGCALVIAAVLVAPGLYYTLGRDFPRGEIWSVRDYSTDLTNFLVPTPLSLVGTLNRLRNISSKFTGDSGATGYVGLPFLVLFAWFACEYRRDWPKTLLIIMFPFTCLLSMGPGLHIVGSSMGTLPWAALTHLPLMDKALPDRLMMYAFLALAVAVSLWLGSGRLRVIRWSLVCAGILLTLPNMTSGLWASPLNTPSFFRDAKYRQYLSPADTVLILPFANLGYQMLWQVEAGMYFKMADGWTGKIPAEVSQWPVTYTLTNGVPLFDMKEQLSAFLAAHEVKAVIIAGEHAGPWPANADWEKIIAPLGIQPIHTGDVLLYPIPSSLRAKYRSIGAREMTQRSILASFSALVGAAHKYCDARYPIQDISLPEMLRRGLIRLPGLPTAAVAGLDWRQHFWLGPWNNDVAIRFFGRYDDFIEVSAYYSPYAEQTYFPYPHKSTAARMPEEEGLALMIFNCRGLSEGAEAAQKRADSGQLIYPSGFAERANGGKLSHTNALK